MIHMTHIKPPVVGWDIGGVNTKAVLFPELDVRSVPFEIQRDPAALTPTLREMAAGLEGDGRPHAVTMTAELSQAFRTKREGVGVVLDALEAAFPRADLRVYTVGGRFVAPREARCIPLEVAASNWAATARLVGELFSDCILIDIGTTSTDIIPVVGRRPAALGRTDPERLASGELVYTGALRTPCEAVAAEVAIRGVRYGLSAEGFALMGDVHLWTGRLAAVDYTVTAPDGRPPTREFSGERLARLVCADREMLDEEVVSEIAEGLAEAQRRRVAAAIRRVRERHPALEVAVVTGTGDFIAADAARLAGLTVISLADRLGGAARTAPAAAVAWLLAESMAERTG